MPLRSPARSMHHRIARASARWDHSRGLRRRASRRRSRAARARSVEGSACRRVEAGQDPERGDPVGDVAAKLGVDQEPAQLLGVLGRESKTLKAPGKAASQVINPHQPRALGLVVGQQTSRLAADIVSEEPIEPRGLATLGRLLSLPRGKAGTTSRLLLSTTGGGGTSGVRCACRGRRCVVRLKQRGDAGLDAVCRRHRGPPGDRARRAAHLARSWPPALGLRRQLRRSGSADRSCASRNGRPTHGFYA